MTFHHGYIAGYVGNDVNKSMPTAEEGETYLFSSGEDRNLSSTISIVQEDNKEKTYYTKPIYRESGTPVGCRLSRKNILYMIERLKEEGYTLVL